MSPAHEPAECFRGVAPGVITMPPVWVTHRDGVVRGPADPSLTLP
ncbi:hypothetical protein [Streptomyces zagrosensis]|uniref:Uncharacterized protein n=1 Tax=Streptomyces zagrosensis TaxID=1042984 RepID=A0A7W9Q4R2_9ACTN|nr:hypothetical protein [Streptomyces zagrosensis]MBB5933581.1 hypothetical protein [Streptomyces zagrosensis]